MPARHRLSPGLSIVRRLIGNVREHRFCMINGGVRSRVADAGE